jgi:predicted nucleic acid-binding protein
VPDGPVVSNTTPLIKLAGVGLLDLLPRLYGEVWIPDAVRDEYRAGALPTDLDIAGLPWLVTKPVAAEPELFSRLGPGEAAAISLAAAANARLVLLDEKLGRRIAAERGLPVAGTLAVLLRAKQLGLVPAVEPVVDRMIAQGRFIGHALRARLLSEAGESTGSP